MAAQARRRLDMPTAILWRSDDAVPRMRKLRYPNPLCIIDELRVTNRGDVALNTVGRMSPGWFGR